MIGLLVLSSLVGSSAAPGSSSLQARLHELKGRLSLSIEARPRETPIEQNFRVGQAEAFAAVMTGLRKRFEATYWRTPYSAADRLLHEKIAADHTDDAATIVAGVLSPSGIRFVPRAEGAHVPYVPLHDTPPDLPGRRIIRWMIRAAALEKAGLTVSSWNGGANDIARYLMMSTDATPMLDWLLANPTIDPGPLTWQEAFEAQATWHHRFATSASFRSPVQPGLVVARWPDGAHLDRLVSLSEFASEGTSMGHCVGGERDFEGKAPGRSRYWMASRDGDSAIYSYRGADEIPLVTIEIALADGPSEKLRVRQVYGPEDSQIVDPEISSRLAAVFRVMGAGYTRALLPGICPIFSAAEGSSLVESERRAFSNLPVILAVVEDSRRARKGEGIQARHLQDFMVVAINRAVTGSVLWTAGVYRSARLSMVNSGFKVIGSVASRWIPIAIDTECVGYIGWSLVGDSPSICWATAPSDSHFIRSTAARSTAYELSVMDPCTTERLFPSMSAAILSFVQSEHDLRQYRDEIEWFPGRSALWGRPGVYLGMDSQALYEAIGLPWREGRG